MRQFTLIEKIYENNILSKYKVKNSINNEINILTVEQVLGLASLKLIDNIELDAVKGRLYGTNGNDLRKLKKTYNKVSYVNNSYTNIAYDMGDKLLSYINDNTNLDKYNQRYFVKDIINFCKKENSHRICIVYGLRRTGKTTGMLQAIKGLNSFEKTAYMSLNSNNSINELYKLLDMFVENNIKYVFLDEVSELKYFIEACATLSDIYAKKGLKIVISGTDSLLLELASLSKLYDRCIKIHTTYIGYREYEFLCKKKTDIMEYIRIGGVLPANIFYNDTHTRDYIDSAISDNIIHSLVKSNNRQEYGRLLGLNDRMLLKKAIEQAISSSNDELTARVITKSYFNSDLGSFRELIEKKFDIKDELDYEQINEKIRYKLSIVKHFDTTIENECISELKHFLFRIGVIEKFERYAGFNKVNSILFVQPGLRYNQGLQLFKSVLEENTFKNIKEVLLKKGDNPRDVNKSISIIKGILLGDMEGNILEHTVILAVLNKYRDNKNIKVTQVNYNNNEYDMVIAYKGNINVYEIKRSKKIVDKQYRHLINKDMQRYVETLLDGRVKNRYVLYNGEDGEVKVENISILYRNISNFLRQL